MLSLRLPLTLLLPFAFLSSTVRTEGLTNATISYDSIIDFGALDIHAREGGQSILSTVSNDFTCGPGKPCVNGACCGADGWCGYEPKYCLDGCRSNCNATAECGTYSDPPGQLCPLNVCCSKYGFCGTTSDFCEDSCQSNCEQPKPSVAKTNVQQKIIAYWEGWNENKACENMSPDEIPVHDISHLVFAFAFITPNDFKVTNMADVRPELFDQVTYLKNKNPDLVIQIALGGWTHNDPGKWQKVFSDMVSTSANRSKFIKNLLGFMSQYGFDGVDFDWEYPGAKDRGGKETDGVNYTKMLQELRQAIRSAGKQYIVTFTAPTSYWYLRHFDLSNMVQYVDWINLMSYDLHGTWDSENPIGSQVLAHTNITEIDISLNLFWRNDIPPSAIVLGIGFYGRSFKLKNSKCWKPGCAFTTGGDKGECTDTSGFLSYSEIQNIIGSTNAKPTYDKEAKVNYLVYGQGNWISYDDKRTFQDKIKFANDRGLNGLMIWAIDLDDSKHTGLAALTGNAITDDNDPLAQTDEASVKHSTDDASQCRVTDCKSMCNQSERAVGRVKSKDSNQCGDAADARYICCPAWTSLKPESCYWNAGGGSVKTDCSGKCDVGDIKVLGDSWGWEGDLKTGDYGFRCLRGGKIFCCNAGNSKRYLDICTWTKCGEKCPSDKQNVLTWDAGGPSGEGDRCEDLGNGTPFTDPVGSTGDASDPTKGTEDRRKLCCPKKDSFTGCSWKGGKVCSEQCGDGQITLDLDPQGQGGKYCDNGRQQAFCCDAPGKKDQPFLPVDLDKIFPPDYLPPPDAVPQFEIVNFGGTAGLGAADPDQTGVAFFLLAGSETGLSSMSKRDNPGLHFLDCPTNVEDAPVEHRHTARIICLDKNEDDCFTVTKGGVEGTIVHLPAECGDGTFVRAVSLVPSQNQSIPVEVALQNPTSVVYDFTFDYDMNLVRRDAGKYSIRMDYSNVAGYWGAVVDSDGNKKRSVKELVERFFSSKQSDWADKFTDLDTSKSSKMNDIPKSDLKHLVFFDAQMCSTDEGRQGQGIAVAIDGTLNVEFFYGFSMIATWDPTDKVKVHQSAGFLQPRGTTSATFTVAGIGTLDTSKKLNGKHITKSSGKKSVGGHSLFKGWASFVPYKEETVRLSSSGKQSSEVSFNGYMEVKTQADWGSKSINFPSKPDGGTPYAVKAERNSTLTPIGDTIQESIISVANIVTVGLSVDLAFQKPYQFAVDGQLPDMAITQTVTAQFEYKGTSQEVCLATSVLHEQKAELTNGDYVGWDSTYGRSYFDDGVVADQCFKAGSSKTKKRQNNSQHPKGDYSGQVDLPRLTDLINKEAMGSLQAPEINCDGCGSCLVSLKVNNICCGCAWLPPESDYWLDQEIIPSGSSNTMKRTVFDQLMTHKLETRDRFGVNKGTKTITFWSTWPDFLLPTEEDPYKIYSERYPQFPDYYVNPLSTANWDGSPNTVGVKKYFHNASEACDSFDVTQAATNDWVYPWPKTGASVNGQPFAYVQGEPYHALYQTEHVFEGQTIARFFTSWLPGDNAATRREKHWVETYILSANSRWRDPANGRPAPFAFLLVDELGSGFHPSRLTVFMTRPNRMKGGLFTGNTALTETKFMSYAAGPEQLLAARELGYVFTYMNLNTVWESFCDTYNAILEHLEDFDAHYLEVTGNPGNLAHEWPLFIRSELDMVVRQARKDLKMMNLRKSTPLGLPFRAYWTQIMAINGGEIQKVRLDRTDKCTNLPASTVGRYTG